MATREERLEGAPPCVARLAEGLAARDFDLIAAQLAPEARWTLVGRSDRFAFGGTRTRAQIIQELSTSLPGFGTFDFEIIHWAHNGDVVFLEAVAKGAGPGEASYSNRYLMRIRLRDGLIVDLLEHYDPFEALAYAEQLVPPAVSPGA